MKHLTLALMLLSSGACSSAETLTVKTLYANALCGDSEASLRFIEPNQLPMVMGRSGLQQTWSEKSASPPHTGAGRLLLISLGQRPSGGYGVALTQESARVHRGVVMLPLQLEVPPPDSLQTQQLTQPCLVVSVQPGEYRQVQSAALPGLAVQVAE